MAAAGSGSVQLIGDFKELTCAVGDGVATITLNRPARKNAISALLYLEISAALALVDGRDDVVCAVLTGAGDYYSSGNDLASLATPPPTDKTPEQRSRDAADGLFLFIRSFIDFSKPLIAGVNGPAFGVAVTTLALCDMVYAAETATFQVPFVSLGQSCEGLSSLLFPQLMGLSKANEVLLTGKVLSANEAEARNLVSAVLPVTGFHAAVHARALAVAKLPANTLKANKKLIRSHVYEHWLSVNRRECDLLTKQWIGEDCMNAMVQFMMAQAAKKEKDKGKAKAKSAAPAISGSGKPKSKL